MNWLDLIQGLGFPVALSVYLIYRDTKDKQSLVKRVELLEQQRLEKEEQRTDKVVKVVEKNTLVLDRVATALQARPCLHNENIVGS